MKGKIYTFYSYKGGVGRTMALANVALLLAERGRRVLCVDFDLEASGLHDYFRTLLSEGWKAEKGVIDLVDRPDTVWGEVISLVNVDRAAAVGRVDLLSSGVEASDFVARLGTVNWEDLYRKGLGKRLEELREQWVAAYDFVLIDSRTGLSDTGGICTVQLPDYIVMVLTANEQSLKGTLDVAERINRARADYPATRSQAPILPLISRFEGSVEKERSDKWMAELARRLTPLYSSWLDARVQPSEILLHTRLPHVGYWSFGEGLPVLEENRKDPFTLAFAYTTLAALIDRELVGTFELVREREEYVADGAIFPPEVPEQADFGFVVDEKLREFADKIKAKILSHGHTVVELRDLLVPGETYEYAVRDLVSRVAVVVEFCTVQFDQQNSSFNGGWILENVRTWSLEANKKHIYLFDKNPEYGLEYENGEEEIFWPDGLPRGLLTYHVDTPIPEVVSGLLRRLQHRDRRHLFPAAKTGGDTPF